MAHKPGLTIPPVYRKLRGYAIDPSISQQLDTAAVNKVIYRVPWEPDLKKGPIGEYVEVVDEDDKGKRLFSPVDLNFHFILAQDGLDPDKNDPYFHQQMVYAVTMTTIKNFEKALGRKILWCHNTDRLKKPVTNSDNDGYIQRLRILPHAFSDANAYFVPEKNALHLGYFKAGYGSAVEIHPSLIYSCLSHDVVAHETAHAIIHGLYESYNNETNADVLAFHEAFADITALFQHFTFPEVLKSQLIKHGGDLASNNILVKIAAELGDGMGTPGNLRDAVGIIDPSTGAWRMKTPADFDYKLTREPHARGSILLSIVFEAFNTIYKRNVADLLRIASVPALGATTLQPDLAGRLSLEAASAAAIVHKMCIRALDYCPPTDITFGDFLRAIVTSDRDINGEDPLSIRLAFIDAFRRWRVYPDEVDSLSEESLVYSPTEALDSLNLFNELGEKIAPLLQDFRKEIIDAETRRDIFNITRKYIAGNRSEGIKGLYQLIVQDPYLRDSPNFLKATGLYLGRDWEKFGIPTMVVNKRKAPSFEIHSLHLASRVTRSGKSSNQIILTILQHAKLRKEKDKKMFTPEPTAKKGRSIFRFTGGATLIFDLDSLRLRYAVRKPLVIIPNKRTGEVKLDLVRAWKNYEFVKELYNG